MFSKGPVLPNTLPGPSSSVFRQIPVAEVCRRGNDGTLCFHGPSLSPWNFILMLLEVCQNW